MSLRVLVVAPIYPSPDDFQSGIFIHRQIANLVRQGVECRVLRYLPAPPPFPRWLASRSWVRHYWRHRNWENAVDGVPVELVYYPRAWTKDEDTVPAIGAALTKHVEQHPALQQTDVVYSHFLWTGGAAALHLREKFGWPVASIARGSEMHDWQRFQKHCRSYVAKVIREADLTLANCRDLRERMEELAPGATSRVPVVYNGCNAEVFRPAEDKRAVRRQLGLDENAKIMLFCGTLDERKGILELAQAWRGFAHAHPEWQLVAVGRATEPRFAEKLRELASLRVTLPGHIPQARILAYYQAADAYIQPSRLEGLANATMEAAAVGLPVITTDTCGQREVIKNGVNGWLTPPQNPAALGQAMECLAANPERAQAFGKAARLTIETDFNPDIEARRLADILRGLAQEKVAPEREKVWR
jgi:glycosyltransferase involved in cell wall biosynthesis